MKRVISILIGLIAVIQLHALPVEYNARIVGGKDAQEGAAPFMASLELYWDDENADFICGATILNEQWILIAAHCVDIYPAEFYEIVAGQYDKNNPSGNEQYRNISKIFIHPYYTGRSFPAHDIALLQLSEPLNFIEGVVGAVDLPVVDTELTGTAILFGWGSISNTSEIIFSSTLQTVEKPLLSFRLCQNIIYYLFPGQTLDESSICTGPLTGGVSACSGDSGSPLTQVDRFGVTRIIGVASWIAKLPCGSIVSPTVYMKVSKYLNWIEQTISQNSQETTSTSQDTTTTEAAGTVTEESTEATPENTETTEENTTTTEENTSSSTEDTTHTESTTTGEPLSTTKEPSDLSTVSSIESTSEEPQETTTDSPEPSTDFSKDTTISSEEPQDTTTISSEESQETTTESPEISTDPSIESTNSSEEPQETTTDSSELSTDFSKETTISSEEPQKTTTDSTDLSTDSSEESTDSSEESSEKTSESPVTDSSEESTDSSEESVEKTSKSPVTDSSEESTDSSEESVEKTSKSPVTDSSEESTDSSEESSGESSDSSEESTDSSEELFL